jgi:hypothetical protein
LEVKHDGDTIHTIKTRCFWIGFGDTKTYEARTGFSRNTNDPWYVPFQELLRVSQTGEMCWYHESKLSSLNDIIEGRAKDITSYPRSVRVNLAPDWKRKFHPDGTSEPFKSMAEFWRYRAVVDELKGEASSENVHYLLSTGGKTLRALTHSLKRGIYHRIALGAPGFRLPKGETFKGACSKLGINVKALTRLKREILARDDFPYAHPEILAVTKLLGLW